MNATELNAFMRAFALAIASQRGFARERIDVEVSRKPYYYYDESQIRPFIAGLGDGPGLGGVMQPMCGEGYEINLRLRCFGDDSFMNVLRAEYQNLTRPE